METIIGTLDNLDLAVKILKEGGVVAFPTETVYGLGADAFNAKAVEEIYNVKGRPKDNPFIVHISRIEDIDKVGEDIPLVAYDLFKQFSPGPLTLIVKKKDSLPLITTGGRDTVGIRIPNHPLALELIKRSGLYLAAPSANLSGRVSPTKAQHVYEDLKGRIELILDGGDSVVGIESTVLDLTQTIPTILRPGAISAEMLSKILSKVVTYTGEIIEAKAPGMKYRHYCPTCKTLGVKTPDEAKKLYDAYSKEQKTIIIATEQFINECLNRDCLSLGKTAKEAMSLLFSSLRFAEKNYELIILQYFDDGDKEFAGINNRIKKAVAN